MGRGCGAGGGLLWGSAVGRLGALWGCCGAALWHFITSLWGYMGSYGPAQHIYGSAPHLWVWVGLEDLSNLILPISILL